MASPKSFIDQFAHSCVVYETRGKLLIKSPKKDWVLAAKRPSSNTSKHGHLTFNRTQNYLGKKPKQFVDSGHWSIKPAKEDADLSELLKLVLAIIHQQDASFEITKSPDLLTALRDYLNSVPNIGGEYPLIKEIAETADTLPLMSLVGVPVPHNHEGVPILEILPLQRGAQEYIRQHPLYLAKKAR